MAEPTLAELRAECDRRLQLVYDAIAEADRAEHEYAIALARSQYPQSEV